MKIRYTIILAILICLDARGGLAQIKPLSIGDQVPDIALTNIINYKKTTANLSDFKGKLLILDFWATWCSPCVYMLPKTDSLQKVFEGKVQFLPVTTQRQYLAGPFLEKLRKNKHVVIPSVIGDKILHNYFPHMFIPYYVWINPEGKVIATTEQDQVTSENIKKVLRGEALNVKNVIGAREKILDRSKQVFILGMPFIERDSNNVELTLLDTNKLMIQSVATKYLPNVIGQGWNNSTHFVSTNTSILGLYQFLYGITVKPNTMDFYNKDRYAIEVDDSIKNKVTFTDEGYGEWLKENGYCYELVWKNIKTWDEKVSLLKDDLDRYFAKPLGIKIELEKRPVVCDILIMTDSTKLKTLGGKPVEEHDAYTYKQRNRTLGWFKNQLTYFWQGSGRSIINETNYKGKVDLDLNCKMSDKIELNKKLAKYGLKVIEAERPLDILIVKNRY
ncbi:TlpA family protein disulfide reductase [Flavobacterium zepuense]|uniref:TlpA family protein disulfide reductase n=1 Tax=Flavobacterium zepuense TaxID=2593302 RepID=A0A552UUL7_9FLAO|nr:TlpA disulfide reductase family protein [Flavobacterium zepuense]TRW21938.1 TlpA family protein disulfide reductase [Flavobacterium zepuense]